MGGSDGSLTAALAYSNTIFAGAVLIWLFNSLANVIRGTGNMWLPAAVACVGAVVLIPVSPLLIFGFGIVPRLGIAGGAVAVIVYYLVGSLIFAFYIWSGRGVLRPAMRPPRLTWPPAYEILRIGAIASIIAVSTNVTIAVATGFAGAYGPAAVAGYGTGVRLEYLLIPLAFGLGAPLVAMVGTNIGAGTARARACGSPGPAAQSPPPSPGRSASRPRCFRTPGSGCSATIPPCWRSARSTCASSGRSTASSAAAWRSTSPRRAPGRLAWPLLAGLLRLAVAVAGGWLALRLSGSIAGVFVALGVALAVFGLVNAGSIAMGAWFRKPPPAAKGG